MTYLRIFGNKGSLNKKEIYIICIYCSGKIETKPYSANSNHTVPGKHRGIIIGTQEQSGALTNHLDAIDFKS